LFKQVKQKWQCHDCREFDLRESCRSLRKQRRHNDTFVGRQAG
jgi:hypothetical protein